MTTPANEGGHETAYERGARHGASGTVPGSNGGGGGGGAGFLSRSLGPLPIWAWLGLVLFAAVGYYVWAKNNKANSTQAASNTSTGTGTTDSSLIPQFVNQVYTNDVPPATGPSTTPTGPMTSPKYGEAGPAQKGFQAITAAQAATLLSNKNTFNPSGHKSQRPFIWNGSAYVPATVLNKSYTYYAGPEEIEEIQKAGKKK
jgi:hypothetical protein